MDPVADTARVGCFGIGGDRFDPRGLAVFLDPEIGRDMVLLNDEALFRKAGKEIKFKKAGGEIVGLQIADEVGIGIWQGEVAFADRHQRGEVAYRARQQLELG